MTLDIGSTVWTWFDTGAFGPSQLRGKVVALGPKAAVIEWQSGFRNRVPLVSIAPEGRGAPITIGEPYPEDDR